ncbi:MAG: aromatic ring-hydroxylating oxygenase subunit alpha [Fimbriimonadaceae bacterium]
MSRWIDPNIKRAWTLPSEAYTSTELFGELCQKLLQESWHYAGTIEDLKAPGSCQPVRLEVGTSHQEILLTRDYGDRLHAMSNVCTHRGALVQEGFGVERSLRCRYHGRRFGLDGCYLSMPEFDGVENFPAESDNLPKLQLAQFGPMVFCSIKPSTTFAEWIKPMSSMIKSFEIDRMELNRTEVREYSVRANWIAYLDNYLEGFHIPYVHPSLNEELDYGEYLVELFPTGSLQIGTASEGAVRFSKGDLSESLGDSIGALYYHFFPLTMFNLYPWGISLNVVTPLAVDRTRVTFFPFVLNPSLREQGAGSALDRVEREDEAVVESVQKGLSSPLYTQGRYSVLRENAVHHFHCFIDRTVHPES